MNLTFKTVTLFSVMFIFCCLPVFVKEMKKISHLLFLFGTGALFGICFFDLLPDVFELGGSSSLLLTFAVWAIYSLVHLYHYRHHEHTDQGHDHLHYSDKGVGPFLLSMIIHCFSSGILLAVSSKFESNFSRAVFLALIAHKGYESLIVSSIIIERTDSKSKAIMELIAYTFALPLGVVIAFGFSEQFNLRLSMIATSIALGTLLGCMLFDFILPSISHVREKKHQLIWVLLGLIITEIMMKTVAS